MEIDFKNFCNWAVDEVPATPPDPLNGCIVDITKDYPPVEFLLQDKDEKGLIARGDIIGIKGKAKQGKSYVCACLETAVLKGQYMGFTATKEGLTILHIDTEQNIYNVAGKVRVVYSLCDWELGENNTRFVPVTLREYSARERLDKTKVAIERYKPDFVFIDGIRDLCRDFNDITESANLIGELMRLCSRNNCAILCVLHENKADGNMRGHLGTELLNKCSETYQVTKDKDGTITVEQTECRNAPVGKWSFFIDEDGVPRQKATVTEVDKKREKMFATFKTIFNRKARFQYMDLVREYMESAPCCERTAKDHIKLAKDTSVISKQENGDYTFGDFPEAEIFTEDDETSTGSENIFD